MIRFILLIIIFCSCGAQKSITMAHVERIEERVMPVAVGADTIEITEYRLQSTNFTPSPTGLPLKQGENKRGYHLSTKQQKHNSPILSPCIQTLPPSPTGLPLKQGENKRGYQLSTKPQKHNSPILSTCIQTLTPSPTGLPLKQGENIASTTSVRSTRGVNISRHETDTTSTLRITLRPDTVFVPYTHHIRSDTIVVPDRICKTKLQKTQTANVLLILILIVIFIIFIRRKHFLDRMTIF